MKRIKRIAITFVFALLAASFLPGCPPKKPSACKNADYVQVFKEQAIASYRKGDYVDALKAAKQAEACRPDDPELYYWLGLIYLKKDKVYEAIDYLKKSLDVDPGYYQARIALGLIYLDLQRWDEAIEQFQVAADDDYNATPWIAYNNMGYAHMQKGEYALAETNLNRAKELNPNFCPTYTNLGELASKQKKTQEAERYYKKALELCPQNYARPYFLLGIEYGQRGDINTACSYFTAAAGMEKAPEAEQAREYMQLYNCRGAYSP